jgi:hypothetical protein
MWDRFKNLSMPINVGTSFTWAWAYRHIRTLTSEIYVLLHRVFPSRNRAVGGSVSKVFETEYFN